MLTLYHMPSAICAQKVRVALAEKGLAWRSELVSREGLRSAAYLSINPMGYVPTLVDDGRIIAESRIISEYVASLEGPSLLPTDRYDRALVARWSKLIDDSLHINVFLLTFCLKGRAAFLRLEAAEQLSRQPLDPIKRFVMQDVIRLGEASPLVAAAVTRFATAIRLIATALEDSLWLAGDAYTLADADYTPYLQRLSDLGLDALWADYPAVREWFDRVRARPSFAAVIDDWVPAAEVAASRVDAEVGRAMLRRLQRKDGTGTG